MLWKIKGRRWGRGDSELSLSWKDGCEKQVVVIGVSAKEMYGGFLFRWILQFMMRTESFRIEGRVYTREAAVSGIGWQH